MQLTGISLRSGTVAKRLRRAVMLLLFPTCVLAQNIVETQISGQLLHENKTHVEGALIVLEHLPSRTKFVTFSDGGGSFYFPNVRTGGPYLLALSGLGLQPYHDTLAPLLMGEKRSMVIQMQDQGLDLQEVKIKSQENHFSHSNRGLSQNLSLAEVASFPISGRSIDNAMKLSILGSNWSFSGKSPRFNSFSIDGSDFNTYGLTNSIVLGSAAGGQPLSLDAIEDINISVAPYSVRQSGFSAANINIVSLKGDNELRLSAYDYLENNKYLKNGNLTQHIFGFNAAGPLKKDKLFFSLNVEAKRRNEPALLYVAERPGIPQGNETRVEARDLDQLSSFLKDRYGYTTGPYENYRKGTVSNNLTLGLDWNINPKHRFRARYIYINAEQEKLLSNSNYLGQGNRNDNFFSMSYQNANPRYYLNAHSVITEINSRFSPHFSNQLIVGYSGYLEKRQARGQESPLVDILKDGQNYISFGSDPYALHNRLKSNVAQFQNHLSYLASGNVLTFGVTVEKFSFANTFLPGGQGVFVFKSLNDFYNNQPGGVTTPLGISSGQAFPLLLERSYSLKPDEPIPTIHPVQTQTGLYLQDELDVTANFRLTMGIRLDRLFYQTTPPDNDEVSRIPFYDPLGNTQSLSTSRLPTRPWLFSPRLGFSYFVRKDGSVKIWGGSGVFNGRTPFVFYGEQFRNNGKVVATYREMNPDIQFGMGGVPFPPPADKAYYIVAFSEGFRNPQIWKSSLGISLDLSDTWHFSVEGVYGKDLHAFAIRNASLNARNASQAADGRFRFAGREEETLPVTGAYVIENTSLGRQWNAYFQLKNKVSGRLEYQLAYAYGNAKDANSVGTTDPVSGFSGMPVRGNPNVPVLSFSDYDQPHRFILLAKYQLSKRKAPFYISVFSEIQSSGRFSYTYAGKGDVNGDKVAENDLIYIPRSLSDIALIPYNRPDGSEVSVHEQWEALDTFIERSPYLKRHRGMISERNGALLPWRFQTDMRLYYQWNPGKQLRKHSIALSLDVFNVLNLIHSAWAVPRVPYTSQPIQAVAANTFQIHLDKTDPFVNQATMNRLWQLQIGVKYSFSSLL